MTVPNKNLSNPAAPARIIGAKKTEGDMDWQGAINQNREALQRIVTALFSMAGIKPDMAITHLPYPVRLSLLRVLRPAESAVRRLIVMAARGLSAKVYNRPTRDFSKLPQKLHTQHSPSFALFDRRKRFFETRENTMPNKGVPRLTIWGVSKPAFVPAPSNPSREYQPERLMHRLKALQNALDDLPKQAQRLARHQMRRATLPAGPKRVGPMRPGYPPAYKKRATHAVDLILNECHALALEAREAPT